MLALWIELGMETKNKIYVHSKNGGKNQFYTSSHTWGFFCAPNDPAIYIPDLKSNSKTPAEQGSKSPLQNNMEEAKQPKQNRFPAALMPRKS